MSGWKSSIAAIALCVIAPACRAEPIVFERDAAREVATSYCQQLFACDCRDSAQFGSEEACLATMEEELFEQQLDAHDEQLTYDQSCVQRAMDRISDQECTHDVAELDDCNDCFIYHGALPEDSECERTGPFSNCAQGLACVTQVADDGEPIDVCMRACARLDEGVVCEGDGPGFTKVMACDEGLVCDHEDSKRCVALPVSGEDCRDDALCGPDAWCDATNNPPICAALKSNGQGCDADLECESTWCRNAERCAAPFDAGRECDPERDRCTVGFECDADTEVCRESDALVCAAPRTSF